MSYVTIDLRRALSERRDLPDLDFNLDGFHEGLAKIREVTDALKNQPRERKDERDS